MTTETKSGVSVYLTPEQKQKLRQKAASAGKGMSQYILSVLLERKDI